MVRTCWLKTVGDRRSRFLLRVVGGRSMVLCSDLPSVLTLSLP
jgi:hypothetical protein